MINYITYEWMHPVFSNLHHKTKREFKSAKRLRFHNIQMWFLSRGRGKMFVIYYSLEMLLIRFYSDSHNEPFHNERRTGLNFPTEPLNRKQKYWFGKT